MARSTLAGVSSDYRVAVALQDAFEPPTGRARFFQATTVSEGFSVRRLSTGNLRRGVQEQSKPAVCRRISLGYNETKGACSNRHVPGHVPQHSLREEIDGGLVTQ
ncbi:MAG: hypothetical protein KatS3mg110_0136 [Pirellulaceae bacterium]|nr:MAG: hypothetical protein KatS3mg110_0136 [Pirellulaceae bacterium]